VGSFIICYINFCSINFFCFLHILFLSYMLSNYVLRITFNDISHEYHKKVVSCKPSPLHSILHFTYPHQNIINCNRIL
jgi:hypothetical protein